MIDACRGNGVKLGVAYYRRFYPVVLKMKDLLDQGAIGRPILVRSTLVEHARLNEGSPSGMALCPEPGGRRSADGYGQPPAGRAGHALRASRVGVGLDRYPRLSHRSRRHRKSAHPFCRGDSRHGLRQPLREASKRRFRDSGNRGEFEGGAPQRRLPGVDRRRHENVFGSQGGECPSAPDRGFQRRDPGESPARRFGGRGNEGFPVAGGGPTGPPNRGERFSWIT